jgi:COMPASS component BRE2
MPERKVAVGQDYFERTTAGWKDICVTALANLMTEKCLMKSKCSKSRTAPTSDDEYNPSLSALVATAEDTRFPVFYFTKKEDIVPYVDKHWKALCTDRVRTPTWWATLGSCLYVTTDLFGVRDESSRSANSQFTLANRDLWSLRPGCLQVVSLVFCPK